MEQKKIDLDNTQFNVLTQIIRKCIPGKTVWAYGSRVTGKVRKKSDLDLAVFDCDATQIVNFKSALEESKLIISVDVMDWDSIPHSFQKEIKKQYVVVQDRNK